MPSGRARRPRASLSFAPSANAKLQARASTEYMNRALHYWHGCTAAPASRRRRRARTASLSIRISPLHTYDEINLIKTFNTACVENNVGSYLCCTH